MPCCTQAIIVQLAISIFNVMWFHKAAKQWPYWMHKVMDFSHICVRMYVYIYIYIYIHIYVMFYHSLDCFWMLLCLLCIWRYWYSIFSCNFWITNWMAASSHLEFTLSSLSSVSTKMPFSASCVFILHDYNKNIIEFIHLVMCYSVAM